MKTKDIKVAFFTKWKEAGWKEDRFGHYHKELEFIHRETKEKVLRKVRVKVQPTSVRIEIKGGAEWSRRTGDYFSRMQFLEDGRIRVGTMFF